MSLGWLGIMYLGELLWSSHVLSIQRPQLEQTIIPSPYHSRVQSIMQAAYKKNSYDSLCHALSEQVFMSPEI